MRTCEVRRLVIGMAAVLGVAMAAMPAMAEEKSMQKTITVSASGQVSAEPDMARVQSGVVTEAETAREALAKNSAAMKKLIAGLKAAGVEPKDIQTTTFYVQPRYTNPREGQVPVIDGYSVTNQVSIAARDLDKLGDVLDQLVSLGANQMNGLSFEVSKAETLKDEARKDAVANALRRAKLFAAAAGAEVGEVIAISEGVASVGPHPMATAKMAMADSVPVERGSETLEASVTVTWALK